MIADAPLRLPADRPAFAWATWRLTVLFAVGVLAARIVYLIWLCPYQLAADEAQYWDWSRRLDLSYYSKGPGVAWAIAASTRPFGVSEWAVRLPAALAAFISTLVLARLAMACTKGNPRVGFVAALLFTLTPIFYGTSQFMTIDAPYITCWIVAAWLAWLVAGAAQEGRSSFRLWALLGAALGLGFLFKYTMLLLIPGLLAFAWQQKLPPAARWTRRLGGLVAAMAFGVAVSPVFIWNTRHGWPTLAHLLGHVGMPGGDVEPRHGWAYNPLWTVGYLLSPFVFLGPPAALLIGFALRRCWQQRKLNGPDEPAIRFALATALPVILFYLVVSFTTDIEMNWSVAGFTVLLIPAAQMVANGLDSPSDVRRAWQWFLGFGLACALAISFGKAPLKALGHLRIGGARLPIEHALRRVSGHRELSARVARLARQMEQYDGATPFLVASTYGETALLAFYAPGHPIVCCAGSSMGGRESSYDYFPDTDLSDPALLGRPAILVGSAFDRWRQSLCFSSIKRTPLAGRVFAAQDYAGPAEKP